MIEVFLWGIKLRINFFYLKSGGYVVRGCVCASHNTGFIFVFSVSYIFFQFLTTLFLSTCFSKTCTFSSPRSFRNMQSEQSILQNSLAISTFPYISRTNSNIFPMIGTKYFLLLEMLWAIIRIFFKNKSSVHFLSKVLNLVR